MLHDRHFMLCCLLVLSIVNCGGCTSDPNDNSRSVVDSLGELDRTRKALEAPPVSAVETDSSSAPDLAIDGTTADKSTVDSDGTFKVKFESSAGNFIVEVHRDWAPLGAERFHQLVKSGFYNECRFFRVIPDFMVQFGINGNPAIHQQSSRVIKDDPVIKSNKRGYLTFAMKGPNSRTTQIFINYKDNAFLDSQGFSPFGEVIEGMHNVDAIYSGYGERPDQHQITNAGNSYLDRAFPELDYVKKATIIEEVP